jgi:polysaccharide chain length determinant protein (PEP-CTERM system associated)
MPPFLPLIRRHSAALWSHRWKAIALAWLICIVGWAAVSVLPNQYQASGRIYADADAVLGTVLRGLALDSSPASEVEVLQRTLLSKPNLEVVVEETGLAARAPTPAAREALIDRLGREIRITNYTRNLFSVTYRDPDPQVAFDVVQATMRIFLESATGSDRRQFDGAREFLLQQIAHYEVRLREAERRRAEFQARYIDLLPSANGGLSRLESSRAVLWRLRGELEDARLRRNLTQQQLEAAAPTLDPAVADGRLAEAERNLRELRLRYTEQHPAVIAARNQLAEARREGRNREAVGARPNPVHEQLRARIVDADVQLASMERQVREAETDVERLEGLARNEPEVLAQFTNLDRDYTVLRRNYEELLARRESIQIADAARSDSDRVKLEVVDPPALPTVPAGPKRALLYTAVLIVGIGAGGALAFLLMQFDGLFYTVPDLRRIGLPVLGGISATGTLVRRNVWARATFAMACLLLLVGFGAVVAGPQLLATALA